MVAAADACVWRRGRGGRDHRIRCRSSTTSPGRTSTWGAVPVGGPDAVRDRRWHRAAAQRHGRTGPSRPSIDTSDLWPTVWRAVSCHESQLAAYERLKDLAPEHHRTLWGQQSFYRVFSTVNGGRARETDLFEGVDR